MNILTYEYELLRMKLEENIYDMRKWFVHIVNHMRTLENVFQNENLLVKIFRFLKRSWQPKVITILESIDLSSIELATLFCKLQEHEMELKRLVDYEEGYN